MFNLVIKCERWRFNKDYGVWVSTEGHFKDRYKRVIPYKITPNGYCSIVTERDPQFAHRLVMMTWRPCNGYEHLTVDHLNHNKRDNSLSNLEWVSFKENQQRAVVDQLRAEDFREHRGLQRQITTLEARVSSLEKKNANLQKNINELIAKNNKLNIKLKTKNLKNS